MNIKCLWDFINGETGYLQGFPEHMAVGTGGNCPPPVFCQPQKIKSIKTTTHISVYRKMAKYAHSSVDIGIHRYTTVQHCILLK